MLKKAGKSLICLILEAQVKALIKRHPVKVVAVAGSVGKTSTKTAIAKVLSEGLRVRFQDGNYNDRLTVPLIFFNQKEPGIFNLLAWLKIIFSNFRDIKKNYPFDVVIVELGTDAPGQIERFKYLKPDLLLITAIAPEHMENFKDLDAVAQEEFAINSYAKKVIINIDDCSSNFLEHQSYLSYGLSEQAEYRLENVNYQGIDGVQADIFWKDGSKDRLLLKYAGKQGAKICLAAATCGDILGLEHQTLTRAIQELLPVNGRMNKLRGIKDSIIIDDTYNSSPSAAIAALDVLYATRADNRIALLGSMNELGEFSKPAHESVGMYCDPKQLDLVVTLGSEANEYLAPIALRQGCRVERFEDPKQAGEFIMSRLKDKTVVLAKGSQNGVFAEESVKVLLNNPNDQQELVRQSPYWLNRKGIKV